MSTIVRKRSLSAAPSTSSPDWFFEFQKMQSPLSALPVFSDFPLDVSEGEDDDSTVGEERPLLSLEPPASFCTSASSITNRTASTTSTASEKEVTTPPPAWGSSPDASALDCSHEDIKSCAEFTPDVNHCDVSTIERGRSIRRERGRGSGVQHTAERIPIRPKFHNQTNNHSRSYQQKSNSTPFIYPQTDLPIPPQTPHPGVGYIRGIGTPPPVANPVAGGVCPPSMGLMPPFGLLAFSPWQIFTPFGLPFAPPSLLTAANTTDVSQKCVGTTQPPITNYQNIASCQQPNNNGMKCSVSPGQSYPLRSCTNTALQGRGGGGAAQSRNKFNELRPNNYTAGGCGSPQGSCCTEPSCTSTGSPLSSAMHANGNESQFCNTRIRHVHPSTWRHEPYPVDTPQKKTDVGPLPIADDGTLLGPLRPADVDPALASGAIATFTGEPYTDRVVILSPELPGDKQKQHKWVEISVNDPQEEPRKRRYRFSGVLPCGHRVFAKRLRFRRGWTYFMCVSCGFKWGESGAR